MHPLLTPLHPALRTALIAWSLGRAICWLGFYARGSWPWALLTAQDASGTLGWSVLVRALLWLDGRAAAIHGVSPSAIAMTLLSELAILCGLIAVYHIARRDALPQSAERATWLFALCPLMALWTPQPSWTLAISGALIAMAMAERARYVGAIIMIGLAVSMRLDAALAAPALAWLGVKAWAPGRAHPMAPWALGIWSFAQWPLSIFMGMFLGGKLNVSLRTLHPEPLRSSAAGLDAAAFAGVGLFGVALALLWRARRETPLALTLAALPALLWPLLHQSPNLSLFGSWGLAIPLFVALANRLDNPEWERPALLSLVGAMLYIAII